MSNISSQSIDQIKLSEAQEYYLGLFRKWQKWQETEPQKLPEGYRSKDEFDFESVYKIINMERGFVNSTRHDNLTQISKLNLLQPLLELCEFDNEIGYTRIIWISSIMDLFFSSSLKDLTLCKDIKNNGVGIGWFNSCHFRSITIETDEGLMFDNCQGVIKIVNTNPDWSTLYQGMLLFRDCLFEKIILDSFDLTESEKETRVYLLELHKQDRLELINCNFPELDNLKKEQEILVLQNELELAQKTTIQPQQIFDFSSKIPKEYWEPFATYFSGFKSFIKRAKGKSLGMEININGDFMFRVYSDDPEDLVGIEQDLSDFLLAITYYSKNQFDSYQKMQNGETVSINNLVMEGKVSQLIQEVKYLELENKTLRTIVSIFPEILQNIQDSIHQNYLQNQLLLEYYKPKIFTEGKTDVDYLKTAIKIFGKQYPELLKVEIDEIGVQEDGQTRDGGTKSLDACFRGIKNKTQTLASKVILLYDCDTNQRLENIDNKLFKVGIKPNNYNQKYKIGIENLLPQSYFETDYYYHNIVKPNEKTGGTKIIIELDKVKLCQDICSKERLEDFKNFEELLSQLNQIIIQ